MDQASDNPGAWAGQRASGDEPAGRVTSGAAGVTSGFIARAYGAIAVLLTLAGTVNIFTLLDDTRRIGHPLSIAAAVTVEFSSLVGSLVAAGIALIALSRAPPKRERIAATLLTHAGASIAFSVVHIGVMATLRWAIFAAAGSHYSMTLGELPYEYRKDLVTYLAIASIFWTTNRLAQRPRPAPPPASPGPAPSFDIRDGNAVLRVAVADIVCAQAAGNYVEFQLADGRRPLMRAPLSQVEAALTPHAFVRTHRSWLVNAARVRALMPAGSGDFRIELDESHSAPPSRRFPDALARLRGAPTGSD